MRNEILNFIEKQCKLNDHKLSLASFYLLSVFTSLFSLLSSTPDLVRKAAKMASGSNLEKSFRTYFPESAVLG